MGTTLLPRIVVRSRINRADGTSFSIVDGVPHTLSVNEVSVIHAAYVQKTGEPARILINGIAIHEFRRSLPEKKIQCILDGLLKKDSHHGRVRTA